MGVQAGVNWGIDSFCKLGDLMACTRCSVGLEGMRDSVLHLKSSSDLNAGGGGVGEGETGRAQNSSLRGTLHSTLTLAARVEIHFVMKTERQREKHWHHSKGFFRQANADPAQGCVATHDEHA